MDLKKFIGGIVLLEAICDNCGYPFENCNCACPYCGETINCDCCIGTDAVTGG